MALIDHLEKLRHFYKLANFRSINEGARAIGISQAGLSKSVMVLEEALETRLFVRSNAGLILTKEGDIVQKAAAKILAEVEDVEVSLRALKAAHVPNRVAIGMYDSIAVYFFSDLAAYMQRIYPTMGFGLVAHGSKRLAEMVSKGELQLAIGVNFDEKNDQCSSLLLFEDYYSFYVSPKHEEDISKLPLLYHPDATDERNVSNDRALKQLLKGRVSHRVYNFETLKTLAVQGLGIGVLPTQVGKSLVAQKQLAPIQIPRFPNLFGRHRISLLSTKEFLEKHRDFAIDIFRLGERWARS